MARRIDVAISGKARQTATAKLSGIGEAIVTKYGTAQLRVGDRR
jgi:hypothetical protein